MRFETVLDRLQSLPDPLPAPPTAIDPVVLGRLDQLPPWVREPGTVASRDAAVLVLIFPAADREAHLVLTERPSGDLRHAGQISFPGGAMDPGDDFPIGTALREATEEVGLDPGAAGVRILGTLGSVDVRVSGFALVPVLAVAEHEPALLADEREVASILLPSVSSFLPDAPIEIVEAQRDGWRLRYGAYLVGGHQIWGATARILGQLGAVLGSDAANGRESRA